MLMLHTFAACLLSHLLKQVTCVSLHVTTMSVVAAAAAFAQDLLTRGFGGGGPAPVCLHSILLFQTRFKRCYFWKQLCGCAGANSGPAMFCQPTFGLCA
jgi:hypothetical protein